MADLPPKKESAILSSQEQTLRLATAVSALAVSQVAVGFDDIKVLTPLLEQVRVQRLDDLAPAQSNPLSMTHSGDAQ